MSDYADQLLQAAAEFIDRDPGTAGFLDRFTASLSGNPQAGRVLDEALMARHRAGRIRFALGAGDIRTEVTSSGARLTACLLAARDGTLAASIQIVDDERSEVAGVAIRIIDITGQKLEVTDRAGRVDVRAAGRSVFIQVGHHHEAAGVSEDQATDVVPLRPALRKGSFSLSATSDAPAPPPSAEHNRPLAELAGMALWSQDRAGGCDLTLSFRGPMPPSAGARSVAPGAQFVTWGRSGAERWWIVPLSPSPLGLSGSLYGTDEDWLDRSSLRVRSIDDCVIELGDRLDEVVTRCVRHTDAPHAWQALSERLGPGPERNAIGSALADRNSLS